MSRVDDLIDLVRSANDIFLINPIRNARMAYILIDNICELTLKSWLQMNNSSWTPVSHQRNGRDYYKSFRTIIDEVKQVTSDSNLHTLLDNFASRREKRNQFFHDQNLSGLTVKEEECRQAFYELYKLLELLFGDDFIENLQSNKVVRAQMVVICLEREACTAQWIYEHIEDVIFQIIGSHKTKSKTLRPMDVYLAIYEDAERVVNLLRASLEGLISDNEEEIKRINGLRKRSRMHFKKLTNLQSQNQRLQELLEICWLKK